MDTLIEPTPWHHRPRVLVMVGFGVIALATVAYFQQRPSTVRISGEGIQLVTVRMAEFVSELSTLCDFQPNSSFKVDTADGGRVTERYFETGVVIEKNQPILLLENPELESEFMRRTAEHLEHVSALATLQLEFERLDLEINERLISLEAADDQQRKSHQRLAKLAEELLISNAEYEASVNEAARLDHLLQLVRSSRTRTNQVRDQQLRSTEQSAQALVHQLNRIQGRIDALQIKAPATGMLVLIDGVPGQQLPAGAEVGEVYTESDFSVRCSIDEMYLEQIEVGTTLAEMATPESSYRLAVERIFPTVTDGRFVTEFEFVGDRPQKMKKGQSARLRVALMDSARRLVLPIGDYLRDSNGTWVFVRMDSKDRAVRREVRMGRRNSSFVEVLGGLTQGESVIVSSYDNLAEYETLLFN